MKIKWGALVVDGRNKIGGHVASKNRAGSYLRTKVTPANPNTSYQAVVRNRLANLAIAWKAIGAANVLLWNNAVAMYKRTDIFGDIHSPSGFNLYQKINNNLAQISLAPLAAPALPVAVPVIITGVLTAAPAGAIGVTFTADPVFTAADMVVDATPAIGPGKSFVKSEFRRIGKYSAVAAHILDVSTLYNAKFGAVGPATFKVFVRMKMIVKATGQAGIPVILEAVITA